MVQQITQNVFSIPVRLVGNPLRSLNAYVVKGQGRSLLIDTGFDMPECLQDLKAGLEELGIDMNHCDLFITHLHTDHLGLAGKIAAPATRVYMGAVDEALLRQYITHPEETWGGFHTRFAAAGFPAAEYEQAFVNNPARFAGRETPFDSITLADGDTLQVGEDIALRCVLTPGHTPGHMCLYYAGERLLFCGDHVLFGITPNISFWPTLPNALGAYLGSLAKIRGLDVRIACAAHRESTGDLAQRTRQLAAHHEKRLCEIEEILRQSPGLTGYEVSARMKWSIRAKDWAAFPPSQKWFAVGEGIAHLDLLENRRRVVWEQDSHGLQRYFLA